MAVLCAQVGISRQAYFQQLQRDAQRLTEATLILELVRRVRRPHPHTVTTVGKASALVAQQGVFYE